MNCQSFFWIVKININSETKLLNLTIDSASHAYYVIRALNLHCIFNLSKLNINSYRFVTTTDIFYDDGQLQLFRDYNCLN